MEKTIIARKAFFSSGLNSPVSKYGEGANFTLEAFVSGEVDQVSGLVINLTDLDKILNTAINEIDHKHLGFDIAEFKSKPTNSFTILEYLLPKIKAKLSDVKIDLKALRLYQGESLFAEISTDT